MLVKGIMFKPLCHYHEVGINVVLHVYRFLKTRESCKQCNHYYIYTTLMGQRLVNMNITILKVSIWKWTIIQEQCSDNALYRIVSLIHFPLFDSYCWKLQNVHYYSTEEYAAGCETFGCLRISIASSFLNHLTG